MLLVSKCFHILPKSIVFAFSKCCRILRVPNVAEFCQSRIPSHGCSLPFSDPAEMLLVSTAFPNCAASCVSEMLPSVVRATSVPPIFVRPARMFPKFCSSVSLPDKLWTYGYSHVMHTSSHRTAITYFDFVLILV